MATTFAYFYAVLDLETMMCMQVQDTTDYVDPNEYPEYIAIPEYDEGLVFTYYHEGRWYYDPDFQNEYIPIWEQ